MRGYFEIGIYQGKTPMNIGTLWRSAYQLGAAGIFVIGKRYKRQASDTLKTHRHIPFREFETFEHFESARPYGCQLIGVEMGGTLLSGYRHPERATYLLGSEDGGLPGHVLAKCQQVVSLEALNSLSYNVAVAGSLVMYHRRYGAQP
jgi:tRNA G18 (ribose-2'-O)-methylase SpoU